MNPTRNRAAHIRRLTESVVRDLAALEGKPPADRPRAALMRDMERLLRDRRVVDTAALDPDGAVVPTDAGQLHRDALKFAALERAFRHLPALAEAAGAVATACERAIFENARLPRPARRLAGTLTELAHRVGLDLTPWDRIPEDGTESGYLGVDRELREWFESFDVIGETRRSLLQERMNERRRRRMMKRRQLEEKRRRERDRRRMMVERARRVEECALDFLACWRNEDQARSVVAAIAEDDRPAVERVLEDMARPMVVALFRRLCESVPVRVDEAAVRVLGGPVAIGGIGSGPEEATAMAAAGRAVTTGHDGRDATETEDGTSQEGDAFHTDADAAPSGEGRISVEEENEPTDDETARAAADSEMIRTSTETPHPIPDVVPPKVEDGHTRHLETGATVFDGVVRNPTELMDAVRGRLGESHAGKLGAILAGTPFEAFDRRDLAAIRDVAADLSEFDLAGALDDWIVAQEPERTEHVGTPSEPAFGVKVRSPEVVAAILARNAGSDVAASFERLLAGETDLPRAHLEVISDVARSRGETELEDAVARLLDREPMEIAAEPEPVRDPELFADIAARRYGEDIRTHARAFAAGDADGVPPAERARLKLLAIRLGFDPAVSGNDEGAA